MARRARGSSTSPSYTRRPRCTASKSPSRPTAPRPPGARLHGADERTAQRVVRDDAAVDGVEDDHDPVVAASDDHRTSVDDLDGDLLVRNARTLAEIPMPWIHALAVVAVDIGEIHGIPVITTGGAGGAVAVWNLRTHRRLAGIIMDGGVTDLRIVSGADQVLVPTADDVFHAFDVITIPASHSPCITPASGAYAWPARRPTSRRVRPRWSRCWPSGATVAGAGWRSARSGDAEPSI